MRVTSSLVLVIGIGGLPGLVGAQEQKEPVYVGSRVCAECHQGPAMGHQYSRWLLSKHAQAFAALSKPEAKKIAQLSGIPEEPQEAAMCLGCHSTAAETEEWERDPTFFLEDGVQCERCHGPGSEYMDADVMMDREAAMAAGMRMPTLRDCMVCHHDKGSHLAVHKLAKLDMNEAWQRISHPKPELTDAAVAALTPAHSSETSQPSDNPNGPRYVGALACAQCHKGPRMGYQFSLWRLSAHADAYAHLSTPEAYRIAREQGVTGNPQESEACLECHVTGGTRRVPNSDAAFDVGEGVGCEACHGPGSDYRHEAVMLDRPAALAAGLNPGSRDSCGHCHEQAHGEPFDGEAAWSRIDHPTESREMATEVRYKTPLNLALSPDARELYVACEASDSVIVVDVARRLKVAEIPVGRQPHDVTFSPEGRRAYVSNRLEDSVSVVDVASRTVLDTFPVGDEPHGIVTDRTGKILFVLNTAEDSISVIEAQSFQEIKRLNASRNPWSLALSPDGSRLLVTNALSRFVEFRTPLMSEVSAVDVERAVVTDRLVAPAANLLQGVAWHPSGDYALITLNRTKNLVPMTRLLQGWTITNGMGVVWRDGRVDQVLLDEPGLCFPDPADVAVTPDGQRALVASSGSDRLAVVELSKLISMLQIASDQERERVFPNHLGKATEFVVKHIGTGKSPRGIAVTPDGRTAFVANALDDSLTVVDMESLEAVDTVDLGGPDTITRVRFGEQLFHSADIAFKRQFSCHTCHPDGHVDGITYDIEPDGLGVSPVDNRTLRGILDTAPFKWEGTNPNLQRQCGPRLAVFFTRVEPFTPDELDALETYIASIPRPPNRYRPLGASLTPAQRRGKALFERTQTNDGRVIPPAGRCINCHPPPLYTDHQRHDVGTKMRLDRESRFDVPHLNNIYDSAPYLHNGIADTLEEIWTRFNPEDKHGVTNDMTKDQLNDLIEYIKTF